MAACVAGGEALSADEGLRGRVHGAVADAVAVEHDVPRTGDCSGVAIRTGPGCRFGAVHAGSPELILWGDSHSDAWEPAMADWASGRGQMGLQISLPGCPPMLGVEERQADGRRNGCAAHNRQALQLIAADPALTTLVIIARWPKYDLGPDADHPDLYLVGPDGVKDPARYHALLTQGFAAALKAIEASARPGLAIVVLEPTPEYAYNVPRCAERAGMLGRDPAPCLQTPAAAVAARQAASLAMLRGLAAAYPNIRLVSADPQLCDNRHCRAVLGGRLAYRDTDHLSVAAVRQLAPGVFQGVAPSPRETVSP